MAEEILKKRGAPKGNQNARKHGFYSKVLDEEERLDYEQATEVEGINGEIALLRVKIKSLIARDPENLNLIMEATGALAKRFLDEMETCTPNKIKAIQIDGGSEFRSVFEEECRKRGIKLFVLPPRSPKLNGGVERANRTHTEEFYEVTDSDFELADIRTKLLE